MMVSAALDNCEQVRLNSKGVDTDHIATYELPIKNTRAAS